MFKFLKERFLTEFILKKNGIQKYILFFGSARILPQNHPLSSYYQSAEKIATEVAKCLKEEKKEHIAIATGGGGGIMEAANKGASKHIKTIGFNIKLPHEQKANPYISKGLAFEFSNFFIRKHWFFQSSVFVIFPGGFGTLDEFFEILTLVQTKKVLNKHCILYNQNNFFDSLITLSEKLAKYGLISKMDLNFLQVVNSEEECINKIKAICQKY